MRLKTMQKSVDEMRRSDPATDFNKSMLERLPPQRKSVKDYHRTTCEQSKYLAK